VKNTTKGPTIILANVKTDAKQTCKQVNQEKVHNINIHWEKRINLHLFLTTPTGRLHCNFQEAQSKARSKLKETQTVYLHQPHLTSFKKLYDVSLRLSSLSNSRACMKGFESSINIRHATSSVPHCRQKHK
jgi:hypothetical protein